MQLYRQAVVFCQTEEEEGHSTSDVARRSQRPIKSRKGRRRPHETDSARADQNAREKLENPSLEGE